VRDIEMRNVHSTVALNRRFPTYAQPRYILRDANVVAMRPPHIAPMIHLRNSFSGSILYAMIGHPKNNETAAPIADSLKVYEEISSSAQENRTESTRLWYSFTGCCSLGTGELNPELPLEKGRPDR
jgi:hypothetical protein